MPETVISIDGIPIRLTDERWQHITEGHAEMAGLRQEILNTVTNPNRILQDSGDAKLAVREIETGKYLLVFYKEEGLDGFILTAFLTRRLNSLLKRTQLWP